MQNRLFVEPGESNAVHAKECIASRNPSDIDAIGDAVHAGECMAQLNLSLELLNCLLLGFCVHD